MEENITKGKELKVKWENRKSDLDGSIKDAQASLAEIKIDNDIPVRIATMSSVISDIEKSLSETETSLNTIRANIMKYEADLSARAEVEKDIETANKEKARLQQDISDWTYLRNACGKNGLQAMEIDGAAPIITSFANDLLTQAFGPLFTVKFRTINEEGKECLDIIVISDDGEEVNLENLSGGQKVWILMALRLAMTLLSKEKSGRNFETFYADELDGALDPDNALNFVNMYRSFMKAGGFKDGYFISHKPSCRSLADNILMFEAGKNPAWE
jgi:DNA repair exonuclease SbcCD ATPase subunit